MKIEKTYKEYNSIERTMSSKQALTKRKSRDLERQDLIGKMNKTGDSTNSNDVFRSQEIQDFLDGFVKTNKSNDIMNRGNAVDSKNFNAFDSKDFNKLLQSKDSLNGIDLSIFKSKESFSDEKPKTINNDTTTKTTSAVAATSRFKSQDWINFGYLGKHVEIPYSTGMFFSTASSTKQCEASHSVASPLSLRTDFSSSSMIHARKNTAVESPEEPKIGAAARGTKKKRKRNPRKKIVPQNKKYAELTKKDVLMGRGGKSNHHEGNARYREQVEKSQGSYKKTDDKDEKTKISEELVRYIKSDGGNFLEKDETGYYIIDDVVARRKVSQALREDMDPDKRKAKRQRFLERRAREH